MSDAAAVAPPLVAGSYLTFHLTQAKYALPVGAIRYITELDAVEAHAVPGGKGGMTRVFTFQQEQISLYNFSRLMGAASQREECQQLVELMAQRRQDHIDWIEALEHSIETGSDFQKATDPHQCSFGRWYDSYRSRDEELKAILAQFDAPHKKIHSLAGELLKLADTDDGKTLALQRLEEERHSTLKLLLRLFSQATARLEDMLKPVVVILNANGHTYAIELDSIDQIMEFDQKHWFPGKEQDLKHPCYDGFLQKTDGELFIRLEPKHLHP